MASYVLSEGDVQFLRELKRRFGKMPPYDLQQHFDDGHQSPDLFVMRGGSGGITALEKSESGTGPGSPNFPQPGSGFCDFYELNELDGILYSNAITDVPQEKVHNIYPNGVSGDQFALAARAKSGHYYVIPPPPPVPVKFIDPTIHNAIGTAGETVLGGSYGDMTFTWEDSDQRVGSLEDHLLEVAAAEPVYNSAAFKVTESGIYSVTYYFAVDPDYSTFQGDDIYGSDTTTKQTSSYTCSVSHDHDYEQRNGGTNFIQVWGRLVITGSTPCASQEAAYVIIPSTNYDGNPSFLPDPRITGYYRETCCIAEDGLITAALHLDSQHENANAAVTLESLIVEIQRLSSGSYTSQD